MECKQARSLLSAYIDHALDKPVREQLEEHLLVCRVCREEHDALRNVVKAVGSLDSYQAPPEFIDKLHERIRESESGSLMDKLIRLLFFPLQIKIPVQVVSAAAVAVIVFKLFHASVPHDGIPREYGIQPEAAIQQEQPLLEKPKMEKEALGTEVSQDQSDQETPQPEERISRSAMPRDILIREKAAGNEADRLEPKDKSVSGGGSGASENGPIASSPAVMEQQSIQTAEKTIEISLFRRAGGRPYGEYAGEGVMSLREGKKAKDSLDTVSAPPARYTIPDAEVQSMNKSEAKSLGNEQVSRKEEAETGKDHTLVSQVQKAVSAVQGSMVSMDYDGPGEKARLIVARIPGGRIGEFLLGLKDFAELRMPKQPETEPATEYFLVRIHIMPDDPAKK